MTNTTRIRFIASLAFGLLVGAAAWNCARAEKPKSRVLLVGVDAGEWDVLGPLLNEGKIPNFARMRDQGDQHIESAATETNRLVALNQQPLRREQAERAERDRRLGGRHRRRRSWRIP